MNAASASHARTRRAAHPGRVAFVTLLALALLAASFVAGRFFQAPDTATVAEAAEPLTVWASVERRAVDAGISFTGVTTEGELQDVTVDVDGHAVVLRRAVKPGQVVRPGDTAGEVSGVVYVFLGAPLALYRDLTEGDRGEDVASLQRALTQAGHDVPVDGVLGASTADALRTLFSDADAPLPAERPVTVGWRQFVPIPPEGAGVVDSAAYGATLDEENPLVRLRTAPPTVEFIADVTQVEDLKAGDTARIDSSAGQIEGTISAIGQFQAGTEGARSGHPVTVAFASDDPAAPPVGQSVTVSTAPADSTAETLAVPQTAVRADVTGSYVVVRDSRQDSEAGASSAPSAAVSEPTPAERRVPITVIRTGGGWASVTGDLEAGDQVKVS